VRSTITMSRALTDSRLLASAFGDDLSSWSTWRVALKAAWGEPLSGCELAVFESIAGQRKPPRHRVSELWCSVGRRGGKSKAAAAVGAFVGTCIDHSAKLTAGETGHVLVLAGSKAQAGVVRDYIGGALRSSPMLARQIDSETADEIRLKGRIVIAVGPNSFRLTRGFTLLAVVGDEISFWRSDESATPDVEVYRAVLPSLAASGGIFVGISSPYRRAGLMHAKHRDCYGRDDDDVLYVKGASTAFNPSLDTRVVDRAMASDPEAARSEWLAEFRSDLSQFLADDLIDGAVDFSRPLELPPRDGLSYHAFADMSGGRHDASCLAIGHREGERVVVDLVRGTSAPHDPVSVTTEFAALAEEYRCGRHIIGDAYSGEWCASAFRESGIEYVRAEHPKSTLYLEGLPLFTRGIISIPNLSPLIRELRLLERRTARSGKDSVDHGPSGSDDFANVLFGAAWLCRPQHRPPDPPLFVHQVGAGLDPWGRPVHERGNSFGSYA